MPFESELTVMGELAPLPAAVVPPSDEVHVTVLLVMALPPLLPGEKATVTAFAPKVMPVTVGAPGTETATKLDDAAEAGLVPIGLVAVIEHVYVAPLVSDPTVIGEDPPVPVWVVPPVLDVHVTL